MSLQKGDKAPDFKLYNSEKQEVSLSDFKGKNVVVLFFPLAFTSVCTAELCEMRDNIGTYANLNAEVLGISVDSLFTLEKFKAEQQLPFNLLSDFNKETSAAYGSLYENFVLGMKGVSKRSAFVIDSEGTVQYAEVLESAGDVPNFEAVQAALKGL
jgi:glutaredoxin-dependent peroxiredoxin